MTVTEAPATTDEQQVSDLLDDLLEKFPPATTDPTVFLGEQFDRGLAWVHFPVGHGGLGLNPKLQKMINERVFGAGGPNAGLPQPDRVRHVRTDRRRVGQRRAEAALPAPAVHRRGDLGPAVLRARVAVPTSPACRPVA